MGYKLNDITRIQFQKGRGCTNCQHTGFEFLAHETFVAGRLNDMGKLKILKVMDDSEATPPLFSEVSMRHPQ